MYVLVLVAMGAVEAREALVVGGGVEEGEDVCFFFGADEVLYGEVVVQVWVFVGGEVWVVGGWWCVGCFCGRY